jgi:hypothetical protein
MTPEGVSRNIGLIDDLGDHVILDGQSEEISHYRQFGRDL